MIAYATKKIAYLELEYSSFNEAQGWCQQASAAKPARNDSNKVTRSDTFV